MTHLLDWFSTSRSRSMSIITVSLLVLTTVAVPTTHADFTVLTIGSGIWQQGIVGQPFSLPLSVSGETDPVTWSISNGYLPDGVSIDASTGLISGIPTTAGSYPVSVQVQDVNGSLTTADFSIAVYPDDGGFSYTRTPSGSTASNPITIQIHGTFGANICNSLTPGFQLFAYSDHGFGWSSPYEYVSQGIVLDRTYTFTLPAGHYPRISLNCGGSNNTFLDTDGFTVAAISSGAWQQGVEGQTFSLPLFVTGVTSPVTWSISNGTLPNGVNIDSSTGLVSGMPTTAGSYPITVQVQDRNGAIVTADYLIEVFPSVGGLSITHSPPGSTVSNPVTFHLHGVWSADICYQGSSTYYLAFTPDNGPAFISSGFTGFTDGDIIDTDYTVSLQPGHYSSVTFICGNGPNMSVPIDSEGITIATIGISPWQQGVVGKSFSLSFSASGVTAPLTWSIANGYLPEGIAIDSSTGLLSGIPTIAGSYPVTVQVEDANGATLTADIPLTVYPTVGGLFLTRTPSGSTISNPVTFHLHGIWSADICYHDSSSYRLYFAPDNQPGFFTSEVTGLIGGDIIDATYTRDLQPGHYSSVTIICSNGPNMIVPDNFGAVNNSPPAFSLISDKTVLEGQTLTFTVSATDPDGDALTYSASNLPTGATFNPATQIFTWMPTYEQAGNYTNVEFTVADNGTPMMLDDKLITITVGHVNRPPIFNPVGPQTASTTAPMSFTVSAADPDGDVVSLSAFDVPTGASFNSGTGVFSWTPAYNQAGIYPVTFVATDNGTPTAASSTLGVVISVSASSPSAVTQNLINEIVAADYPTNQLNSYLANLRKVVIFINNGQIASAINQLNAFIQKVNQDYQQNLLTQTDRDYLIGEAQSIISTLL